MGKTLLVLKLAIIRYLNALGGFSFYRSSELVFPYAFLTWKIFIIFQVVVVGGFHSITPSLPVKAGFHMIANDRGSRIADRKKFGDRLRSCDRDRRRSQKIEPCSIFCDRLRSFAINCDCAIIWKPKFCDLRSKRIP